MPQVSKYIFIVLGIIAAVGIYLALSPNGGKPVDVVHAHTGEVEELVTSSTAGTVYVDKKATLSVQTSGKVKKIFVRKNQSCDANQIIMELDTTDLERELRRLQLEEESTRLKKNQADSRLKVQKDDLKRLADLLAKGISSQQDHDRLQKEVDITEQELKIYSVLTDEIAVRKDDVKAQISYASIKSAFAGHVTELMVEEGEYLTVGRPVATVVSTTGWYVSIPIDEVDIVRVSRVLGMKGRVRLKFDAEPDKPYTGSVFEISPVATIDKRNNRTVEVKILTDNPVPFLRYGMSCNCEIIIESKTAMTLPTNLLMDDRKTGLKFVLVVRDGRAVKKSVKIGLWNWEVCELTEGVTPSDSVIINNANEISENDRVAISQK